MSFTSARAIVGTVRRGRWTAVPKDTLSNKTHSRYTICRNPFKIHYYLYLRGGESNLPSRYTRPYKCLTAHIFFSCAKCSLHRHKKRAKMYLLFYCHSRWLFIVELFHLLIFSYVFFCYCWYIFLRLTPCYSARQIVESVTLKIFHRDFPWNDFNAFRRNR